MLSFKANTYEIAFHSGAVKSRKLASWIHLLALDLIKLTVNIKYYPCKLINVGSKIRPHRKLAAGGF